MILRIISALLLAAVLLIIGAVAGATYYAHYKDTCVAIQNVDRGQAWVEWHVANAVYDAKRHRIALVEREGLDLGCAIGRAS